MLIINQEASETKSRVDVFRELAARSARGEVIFSPRLLDDEARRLHVRMTLREDHQFRIHNRPEGAQAKFDKLAKNPFKFFRGTALLYYRDYAGSDGHLPTVFSIGDVHPENFGVMPNEHGAPFFGVNDFDEAYFAPFSWDVKRGAVGFYLAAKDNGLKKKHRLATVERFVRGYLDALLDFARDDREKWHQWRVDNAPQMIRELLEDSQTPRKRFLEERVDLEKARFRPTDEIVPQSKRIPEFQQAVDAYREQHDIQVPTGEQFEVKDVAIKKDSGTASLGLDRYYVLIDGPTDDHADDVILEFKQTRRSALAGLVPEEFGHGNNDEDGEAPAERIIDSHAVHLVGGDPYYGLAELDGQQFLVRERSPFKDDIDVDDLDDDELCEYASICGATLAHAHARSDEDTGIMEGDAEQRILASIRTEVFVDDVVRFSHVAAKRILADYKLFRKDHELGAFSFMQDR